MSDTPTSTSAKVLSARPPLWRDAVVLKWVTQVFLLFVVLTALWFLNVSMKYYDHLDVIPIFMTSLLVFNICYGLVLLDEMDNYVGYDYIGIVIGVILCIFGISLLVAKNAEIVKTKALTNTDEESDEYNKDK